MAGTHVAFGWLWILAGLVAGAIQGLFFHREDWLGGYGSWSRRMTRLGHVAFVGTGLLNLAFGFSVSVLSIPPSEVVFASRLFLAGAVAMPLVCYLSSWRKSFRHLFALPVVCLVAAVAALAARAVASRGGLP